MNLSETARNWEKFAQEDPLWAILTGPDKYGNRWDEKEFFQTGKGDIDILFSRLAEKGIAPAGHGKALDFGCGVGRLTQALAEGFDGAHGVDIAPSMILLARDMAKGKAVEGKLSYYQNSSAGLPMFESDSFDFICSLITLQHMEPRYGKEYVREFIRVLKPGGICAFQMPSHVAEGQGSLRIRILGKCRALLPESLIPLARMIFLRRLKVVNATMEMHCIPVDEMKSLIRSEGGTVIDVLDDHSAGPYWSSFMYVVGKDEVPVTV